MALPPLTTILNNAPLIIQGASKLVSLIRSRNEQEEKDITNSPEDLKEEFNKIHHRLKANDDANIQQIKLIEELAKQNETLASSLQKSIKQLNLISGIAVVAIIMAGVSLLLLLR